MDPFSILGITIALVGAAVNVSEGLVKLISHIKDTPNELLQASNDVSDFRGVLLHIEHSISEEEALRQTVRSQRQGRLALPDLSNVPAAALEAPELLRRAKTNLIEIEEIVKRFAQPQNTRGFGAFSRIGALDRRRLKILRVELNTQKVNIATHFSVKASTCALRSGLVITKLVEEVSKGARESEDQRRMLDRILQQVSLIGSDEGRWHSLHTWNHDPTAGGLPSVAVPQIQAAPGNGHGATGSDGSVPESVDYSNSIFKLDVSRDISRFRKGACRPFCSCICHKRYRRRAPTLVNKLLGSIFLGYSNIPFMAVKCDEPSTCTRPSTFSATFTYYFPTWFVVKHMFSLVLARTPLGDPAGVLKIRKIQYTDFSIFRMASIGDWRGIKSILNEGAVHPSTTWWGQWSPLHYAVSYGHATVCRYLLSRNADPLLEDGDNQQSALEFVWTKILGKAFAPQRLLEFESIFANRECLEEFGFPTLHRIVLGLHGGNLLRELASFPGAVNSVDNEGRTALSWAAQRGDIETLKILLSHGADHSISSKSQTTALHYAVEARNPTCIVPLLQAGADPNATDHRLHTPLHHACKASDDPRYIEPLLLSGADPNAMTDYDFSPLIIGSESNHFRTVRCLLGKGSKINLRGQQGKTPLVFAVEYNAHDVLRLLLEHNADYKVKPSLDSPTIAHVAARFADVQTLGILAEHFNDGDFDFDDLSAEDYDGLVLEKLVRMRLKDEDCAETGLGDAFRALIDKIVSRGLGGNEVEGEVWEDAVERFEDEN